MTIPGFGLSSSIHLKLPATSANLGPGFDALGLALSLYLEVEAGESDRFLLHASGRDAAVTGVLEGNLILDTYRDILQSLGLPVIPLHLSLRNEIPLGMGCGSSAAALCAGVFLASHFGGLGWTREEMLNEAARREGHPDNVAACLCGGMTASLTLSAAVAPNQRHTAAATLGLDLPWRLVLALPHVSFSTAKARLLLPDGYSRSDAVQNVQSTAMLVAAFALNRPDLLLAATRDRFHQPYRMEACPLLRALLPLAGKHGVLGVTLSGAGPAVLLFVEASTSLERIRAACGDLAADLLEVTISHGAEVST